MKRSISVMAVLALAATAQNIVKTGGVSDATSPARASGSVRPLYIALAFHDVVDKESADEDAVTAGNLVSFFEWMRANGWNAITLDDVARARAGTRPLPDRAILISFDDGFRSLYTRVYPLVLAYKIPVVASLVGGWIDHDSGAVRISWAQAREMQLSGLVEFASHSYDMHHSHLANPQGGEQPMDASRAFDTVKGYETEDEYRERIRADLELSRSVMQKELGRAPRALAWPYGRSTGAAEDEALAAKFEFLLTLDPEPGFPGALPIVPRLLPVRDPDLAWMVLNIGAEPPNAVRLVRLNPGVLSPDDPNTFEKALGGAIERLRVLGATSVVVDAAIVGPSGRLETWFPNRVLPVKADVLSRIVWQLRTRASVEVAVSLPVAAARANVGDDASVLRLFEDLGNSALADAVLIDNAPTLTTIPVERSAVTGSRWEVRRRRRALDLARLPAGDALALHAFLSFESVRPACRLFLVGQSPGETPSAVADLTLIQTPPAAKPFGQLVERLKVAGWFAPDLRYRSGVWIRAEKPPSAAELSRDVRLFQRRGGVAFGWEPDDPIADEPKAAQAAPSVSAARFPLLRKP